MRSRARLVSAEDPPLSASGGLDLSPDLCQLADQLNREANGLANRFPPDGMDVQLSSALARSQRQRLARWVAAISIALLIPVASVGWLTGVTNSPMQSNPSTTTGGRLVNHELDEPATELNVSPALMWEGVSQPELEGLLDMGADTGLSQVSF